MAKRPTLTDVTSLTNSSAIHTLNQNWDSIQSAFDNTLSLDGSTPNAMNADLDLNGNALINVGTIDVTNLTLDGQTVTDIASVPEWRGAWVTATAYVKNDLVKINGNVYICLVSHTSAAAFSTDLTAVRWELMVTKGDSGVGSGDLVSTNNLSDVANVVTARSNLGLGTVATENTVPVAKGGTGSTTAADARTALGAQVQDAFLDNIAALTDPNADRLLFWDDSAGAMTFLTPGSGLSISGTTITASDSDLFFRLDSAHAGANSTAVQNVFPQSVTLEANTAYEYELCLSMGKTAGTNTHGLSIGFGGTHTLNNVLRHYITTSFNSAATEAVVLVANGYLTSSALRDMTGASAFTNATANFYIRETGSFSVNASGTWFPSYQLTAAPGGAWSTVAGSFVRLRRLGASGSNSSQGTWA